MRAIIDTDRCEGHGKCQRIAPEIFKVVEDTATVLLAEIPANLKEATVRAANTCPRQAITIEGA